MIFSGWDQVPKQSYEEVSSAHGSHYIIPALFQGSQSLYSGVSQASVVSILPVDDHDHGSYVAPTPGTLPTMKSVSTTSKSKSHIVETPQPLPTASVHDNTKNVDASFSKSKNLTSFHYIDHTMLCVKGALDVY